MLLSVAIVCTTSSLDPVCAAGKANTCSPCNIKDGCAVIAKVNMTSVADCCAKCQSTSGCGAWTLNTKESQCHLKSVPTPESTGDCTSGTIPTAPTPPPAPTPAPQPPDPSKPNILFLMCDSMDGRVLDPTSPVYKRLEMPNLRALAARGVNFVNTYAASPQVWKLRLHFCF